MREKNYIVWKRNNFGIYIEYLTQIKPYSAFSRDKSLAMKFTFIQARKLTTDFNSQLSELSSDCYGKEFIL
jgi:hypothetical protein